ncbi:hypothetical protein ACFL27_24435 [candidate division CSSED10-310 bacterium]|uniref:Uncharacterized protein n=1 Tax=candidate division CSSED10-310 bacterium TaxID=2855610 RepID=A0ABV6Z4I2_UNCC1
MKRTTILSGGWTSPASYYVWSITESPDSGYVCCGVINAFDWDQLGDGWMVKLDRDGNMIWEKVYPSNGRAELFYLIRTSDDGYLATGAKMSEQADDSNIWVIKTDANGNTD